MTWLEGKKANSKNVLQTISFVANNYPSQIPSTSFFLLHDRQSINAESEDFHYKLGGLRAHYQVRRNKLITGNCRGFKILLLRHRHPSLLYHCGGLSLTSLFEALKWCESPREPGWFMLWPCFIWQAVEGTVKGLGFEVRQPWICALTLPPPSPVIVGKSL